MEIPGGIRVQRVNSGAVSAHGQFVLYWMIAARRATSNFGLDRAIAWARALKRPVVVLEALRVDYPFASNRLHQFVLDGMRDNEQAFAASPILYYPYVELAPRAGRGLLAELARHACVVVTDEFPCFFLPRLVTSAARQIDVRLEAVDSNGILPLGATAHSYSAAGHFRRHMQKALRNHLVDFPSESPLADVDLPPLKVLPFGVDSRWPRAGQDLLKARGAALAALPIDHAVTLAPIEGGGVAARATLQRFVATRLPTYHEGHNHPDDEGTSRLSPYLHFGHISAHEVFTAVLRHESWSVARLGRTATGNREGWWGVGPGAEAFLDQLVVWRELAFNTCWTRPHDYDKYESLPVWALETLAKHAADRRPVNYSDQQLEQAETHDEVWNAAQRQLRREGWFHNYLRMLWGKKILEWSPSPQEALRVMRTIMDKWSLDGRDPNSYAGYFWTLGRYDRPWPERPIFGTVRSMSSERAKKKLRMNQYLQRYGPDSAGGELRQEALLPM